jgi:sodium-independent sulfate anion transporter 11
LSTGFVIDFISGPVSSGFTSAAALIIATSQVKDILGISASGSTFIESWNSLFRNMHNTRIGDTILGIVCIIILLLMRVQINFTDFILIGFISLVFGKQGLSQKVIKKASVC